MNLLFTIYLVYGVSAKTEKRSIDSLFPSLFGRRTGLATLMIRRREKSDKYKSLVEECKKQLNCEATLLVYIVSSLGALPAETLEDLKKVTKSVKDAGKLAGRMVAAALRESMILYYGFDKLRF